MLSAGSRCVSCGPGAGLEKVGRGFGAGLGGLGREERGLELLFVWAWRRFGEGLARVWHGFGAAWGCGLGMCFEAVLQPYFLSENPIAGKEALLMPPLAVEA